MPTPKIDDTAYETGQKFFREGKSLRSVIEPILDEANVSRSMAEAELTQALSMSTLLGFTDAFLDHVRAPY